MSNIQTIKAQKTAVPAGQRETPCYVTTSYGNWIDSDEKAQTMYNGRNCLDCMEYAYVSGAMNLITAIRFELLPACTEALDSVSKCLSENGERCAPNMSDFVSVANALTIIDDFYQMINSNT